MNIYITLVVLPVLTNTIRCESATNSTSKDVQQKYLKSLLKDLTSTADPLNLNPSMQTSRVHQSDQHTRRTVLDDTYPRFVISSPHLTKLAKTLSLSFDPSFSKDYFEPFERRPRPVTLVAFRKNGLVPKQTVKYDDDKLNSLDVAELQSPYNDVGSFWQDGPGDNST